jgi:hypothetical protein
MANGRFIRGVTFRRCVDFARGRQHRLLAVQAVVFGGCLESVYGDIRGEIEGFWLLRGMSPLKAFVLEGMISSSALGEHARHARHARPNLAGVLVNLVVYCQKIRELVNRV